MTQKLIKKGQTQERKGKKEKKSAELKKKTSKVQLWIKNLEKNLNPFGIVFLCLVVTIVQTILYRHLQNLAIPSNPFKILKFYEQGFMVQYLCIILIDLTEVLTVVSFIALIAIAIWVLIEMCIILYCIISTIVAIPIMIIILGFLNIIQKKTMIGIDIIWENKIIEKYQELNERWIKGMPWIFRIILLIIIGGTVVALNFALWMLMGWV